MVILKQRDLFVGRYPIYFESNNVATAHDFFSCLLFREIAFVFFNNCSACSDEQKKKTEQPASAVAPASRHFYSKSFCSFF